MNKKEDAIKLAIKLFRKSIDEKWIPIQNGLIIDQGRTNCPLCEQYWIDPELYDPDEFYTRHDRYKYESCRKCPLYLLGGKFNCAPDVVRIAFSMNIGYIIIILIMKPKVLKSATHLI